MEIHQIWRFPVKSMQGEQLDHAEVTETGIEGDRQWGLVDVESGKTLTARREPRLLFASARYVSPDAAAGTGPSVSVTLPDGTTTADDEVLSEWIGRPVKLTEATDLVSGHYETQADETETGDWLGWDGPAGSFHDSTRARVSLVSTTTLGEWASRRFRINVILAGEGEDALVGSTLNIGGATFDVRKQIDRCVMVTRPQPDGIDRDLSVLKSINTHRQSFLGIGSLVEKPGVITVGDAVQRVQ